MSDNNVVSDRCPYLRSFRPARANLPSLAGILLVMGHAAVLEAQDREPITFETGIGALSAVTVFVHDQERALRWYTERLGFEIRADEWYASGDRSLAIAPPGQDTPLIFLELAAADRDPRNPSPVGTQSGWVFQVADLVDTYARLRDLDVRFEESPTETMDGWRATFVDLYGNRWRLWQPLGG